MPEEREWSGFESRRWGPMSTGVGGSIELSASCQASWRSTSSTSGCSRRLPLTTVGRRPKLSRPLTSPRDRRLTRADAEPLRQSPLLSPMRASPSRDYQEAPERQDQKSRTVARPLNPTVPVPSGALESKSPIAGGFASRRSARFRSACAPYRRLGSIALFSLNSFQLINPTASGDEDTAASYSRRNVSPSARGTTVWPPIRRASNPGRPGRSTGRCVDEPPRPSPAASADNRGRCRG